MDQALASTLQILLPSLSSIPSALTRLAAQLLAQSRSSVPLPGRQEHARAYLCAHIAANRLVYALSLPKPTPNHLPITQRQYDALYIRFAAALGGGNADDSPRKRKHVDLDDDELDDINDAEDQVHGSDEEGLTTATQSDQLLEQLPSTADPDIAELIPYLIETMLPDLTYSRQLQKERRVLAMSAISALFVSVADPSAAQALNRGRKAKPFTLRKDVGRRSTINSGTEEGFANKSQKMQCAALGAALFVLKFGNVGVRSTGRIVLKRVGATPGEQDVETKDDDDEHVSDGNEDSEAEGNGDGREHSETVINGRPSIAGDGNTKIVTTTRTINSYQKTKEHDLFNIKCLRLLGGKTDAATLEKYERELEFLLFATQLSSKTDTDPDREEPAYKPMARKFAPSVREWVRRTREFCAASTALQVDVGVSGLENTEHVAVALISGCMIQSSARFLTDTKRAEQKRWMKLALLKLSAIERNLQKRNR
ncbi:origin recognition complex subunit 6-domain-containing protein [Limtongia smithiae]|uniref:origin recognition complex subunit 6-domain-containing protein n=1 Tax=Limtongia smithiae TaxID=1125753 RepID=UPI0034CEE0DC